MVDIYVPKTDPFHVEHIEIDLVHNHHHHHHHHHHRCFEILFSCVVAWHLGLLVQLTRLRDPENVPGCFF
jgi:hypothetical protein